jgi:hypothetical protein
MNIYLLDIDKRRLMKILFSFFSTLESEILTLNSGRSISFKHLNKPY